MRLFRLLVVAFSAAPRLYFSWTLWRVWQDPSIEGGAWPRFGMGLFALEFFLIVNQGGSIDLMYGKRSLLPVLAASLGLLVGLGWTWSESYRNPTLSEWYLVLAISHYLPLVLTPLQTGTDLETEKQKTAGRLAKSILLILLWGILLIAVPWPHFGMTEEVLLKILEPQKVEGARLHAVIGSACVFYFLHGFFGLFYPDGPSGVKLESPLGRKKSA